MRHPLLAVLGLAVMAAACGPNIEPRVVSGRIPSWVTVGPDVDGEVWSLYNEEVRVHHGGTFLIWMQIARPKSATEQQLWEVDCRHRRMRSSPDGQTEPTTFVDWHLPAPGSMGRRIVAVACDQAFRDLL